VILPRMLDKGRALNAGKQGEFVYNSSLDQRLVQFLDFDHQALREQLATGKGDGEILEWVNTTAKKYNPWEIQQWSDYMINRSLDARRRS
jgi:hypothetical protein